MSLSETLFGRDSAIFKATNILGLGIPGWLDKKFGPKDTEGPRLSDLSVQTSTYGAPIPRLYGTIAVMGNVIWLENNKLKETVRKKKSGGKGGGGSSEPTKTYSYSATFHLALCEGPIAGIRRMWCGDKLLYNAGSDDLETIIASNQAAKGWKLYLGTDDQLPDSRYEANVGVGNASAHRGLAYLAFYDFQLADYSNTLQGSQFKIEVVSAQSVEQPDLIGVEKNTGSIQLFTVGCPGGTLRNAYFAASLFYDTLIYSMRADGALVGKPVGPSTAPGEPITFLPSAVESIDTTDHWFSDTATLSGTLYSLKNKDLKAFGRSSFDQLRVVERSGHVWFRYSYDDTIPGSPGGGNVWVSKYPYADVRSPAVNSGTACATTAGDLVVSNFTIGSFSGGICNLSIYRNGSFVEADSFNIVSRIGEIASQFSASYVDDFGVLHILSAVNLGPYTSYPPLYGKFWYMAYDLLGRNIVRQDFLYSAALSGNHQTPNIIRVEDGIIYASGAHGVTSKIWRAAWAVGVSAAQTEPLAWIIRKEVELSSLLSSADLDIAGITEEVRGYRVSGGTSRSNLEPLQAAFSFDVRSHGYQVQFLPRGQAAVETIPWDDIAAGGDTAGELLPQSREMDTQLPARTSIKYLDASREYAIAEQYSERLNTEAINRVERELSLVLTAAEAAGVAEKLNFLPWLERTGAQFNLPPIYRHLEPGDVITIQAPAAVYELRLTDVNETPYGRLECIAKPNRAALYVPVATGAGGVPATGTIGLAGESLFVPLDIPVIDETLQDAPGFVGVMTGYADGWPGGVVVRSADEGQTWTDLQAYTGKASIGTARGTLPVSDCTLIDQRNLTLDMVSGELSSVTRDQMLAGINYAAYGLDGRWEVVRFQSAALQGDGSYVVSGFVRGEKGTEWATGLHAADDYFVLLDDPDNAFIGSSVESILSPRLYRGITSGGSLDAAVDVPFTYRGVNLECLSPVYARGSRDGSSNFTGTFTRRSRLSSSWWLTGIAAPVGEASESYEIDVMSGSTVKRAITASSPSFAYSAANQTTDFGSPQASITFRIYQLSATLGRGYPLEVTL